MNQEMAKEKAFDEIVKAVQHLIKTKRGPSTLEQILRDYRLTKGKHVAYEKLGYKSEQDLLEASKEFSLKEKNGKIFIEIKKPKRKLLKSIKSKSTTSLKITKSEEYKEIIKSGKDLDKEGLLTLNKFDDLKLNGKKVDEINKIPIEDDLKTVRTKMNARIFPKKSLVPKITKSDMVLNQKSNEKIPPIRSTQRQQLLNDKMKVDKEAEKVPANINENKIKIKSNYSTALTRVSTLSSPLMKSGDPALDYLELHLVHILHTKVGCHVNGFDADDLPEWYERTFERPIENGWFDLVNRSRKFAREKINGKTILYALNDDEVISDIEDTVSLDKEISLDKRKISNSSSVAIEGSKSLKLNSTNLEDLENGPIESTA